LLIPQKHFIDDNFSFYYFLFVQPPWTQVADMLFLRGVACEQYKQLQKIYDFKNKVVSVMKSDLISGRFLKKLQVEYHLFSLHTLNTSDHYGFLNRGNMVVLSKQSKV